MADAALARREARRRKILENSHNRLQRISGKAEDETCRESSVQSPISDYENYISSEPSRSKSLLSNGLISDSISPTANFGPVPEEIVNQYEVINDLASLMPSNSSNTNSDLTLKSSLLYNVVFYKYDILLLSLFIQILYYFSYISIEDTYFFLPLFIYVSTKQYWFTQQINSSSNLTNILTFLKGVSTQRVQKILNLIRVVCGIGLDACIFVFTTICMQAVHTFLTESFITVFSCCD